MIIPTPILSITGSDNTGMSGIQSDIKTITAMGGYALTAVTSVTVQDIHSIKNILDLPQHMVIGQVQAIIEDMHPKGIKIGMVRDEATIHALGRLIRGLNHVVLVPGIVTSHGKRLLSSAAIQAWKNELLPHASMVVLRCGEAELLMDTQINANDDMLNVAQELLKLGAQAVMLRGGHHMEGHVTSLLLTQDQQHFFTSQDTHEWQRHGVSTALSAAITTRLALGDNPLQAVQHAHDHLRSQVIYAVDGTHQGQRPADLYNEFMTLIAAHHRHAHDVTSYASRLAISTRYLNQITEQTVQKSPKKIIDEYLLNEACAMLHNTRQTVSEVADKLGFSSLAMFSSFFKKHQGISPVDYKKRMD